MATESAKMTVDILDNINYEIPPVSTTPDVIWTEERPRLLKKKMSDMSTDLTSERTSSSSTNSDMGEKPFFCDSKKK